ncbi:hypothetical protein D3C71_1917860 [compost metagenome]
MWHPSGVGIGDRIFLLRPAAAGRSDDELGLASTVYCQCAVGRCWIVHPLEDHRDPSIHRGEKQRSRASISNYQGIQPLVEIFIGNNVRDGRPQHHLLHCYGIHP